MNVSPVCHLNTMIVVGNYYWVGFHYSFLQGNRVLQTGTVHLEKWLQEKYSKLKYGLLQNNVRKSECGWVWTAETSGYGG